MDNGTRCAFPADAKTQTDGGLTKREYFAIQALQGILSNSGLKNSNIKTTDLIEDSVVIADLLLKELEKNNEPENRSITKYS